MAIASRAEQADQLGRLLVACGLQSVRTTTDVVLLRQGMVAGDIAPRSLLVINLDSDTIENLGRPLQRLLADRGGFDTDCLCIGWLSDDRVESLAAELGCDVNVADLTLLRRAVRTWIADGAIRRSGEPVALPAGQTGGDLAASEENQAETLTGPRFGLQSPAFRPDGRSHGSDGEV